MQTEMKTHSGKPACYDDVRRMSREDFHGIMSRMADEIGLVVSSMVSDGAQNIKVLWLNVPVIEPASHQYDPDGNIGRFFITAERTSKNAN